MGTTQLLLCILGSRPPNSTNIELVRKIDTQKKIELYLRATVNKLGFTYLKALENSGLIGSGKILENKLKILEKNYIKYLQSIKTVSEILNKLRINHVFIKTIYDFPVIPSDIDLLVEGKISSILEDNLKKKGLIPFDRGPHFVSFFNTLVDPYLPREKKCYDVDIYDEISLSYLVYLDKRYCFDTSDLVTYNGIEALVPSPEYELIIHLNHSIFEGLYNLFHFYVYLNLLYKINEIELVELINKTRSYRAFKYTSSLTRHFIEKGSLAINHKHKRIIDYFAGRELKLDIDELPYRYSLNQVLQLLSEKLNHSQYLRHMLNFAFSILDPLQMDHVTKQFLMRRKRLTY
jgi:hypothetical protein